MLTRKNFLKTTGLLTAGAAMLPAMNTYSQETYQKQEKKDKIKPKRLEQGDTIGLITPAGVITEDQLNETIVKIEELGFKTYHLPSVLSQYGYFAGTDQERVDEIMHMFTNETVDAIWCVRGGYGGIRMLDLFDFEVIAQNPKVIMGYSDVTSILNAIYDRTGLITFHGPVGISTFCDFAMESIDNVLFTPKNRHKFPYLREEGTEENPEYDLYTITEGKAEGELAGGNLSVLASMIGSEFEVDYKDKIVFLEDVDEKVYSIDRWLTMLLNGSNIHEAAAIVLGAFHNCSKNDEPTFTLKEVIDGMIKPLNIPASYGLSFGHIANKFTIPVGVHAKFDAGKNKLQLTEKAVL
jgi:muramoyltetrapeptide carboxypeptidase